MLNTLFRISLVWRSLRARLSSESQMSLCSVGIKSYTCKVSATEVLGKAGHAFNPQVSKSATFTSDLLYFEYHYYDILATADGAESLCMELHGGTLASVESEQVNDVLKNLIDRRASCWERV